MKWNLLHMGKLGYGEKVGKRSYYSHPWRRIYNLWLGRGRGNLIYVYELDKIHKESR